MNNLACQLKTESHDDNVSMIMLRTDNTKSNLKWCELNFYLKEKNEENNFYLIENSKWIKPRHLNKGKLNLNKNGSKILANNFIGEISKVFN